MNNGYMNFMISENMSQNTIRAYTSDINACLEFINKPESEIKYKDLLNWKASINHMSSASLARKVASIKKYFEYLYDVEEISSNPSVKLASVAIKNKVKTALAPDQIRSMVNCADKLRSKAIITMLASTGMRISELINLTINQYHNDPIIIKGKGEKERVVYITDETRDVVDQYLETRNKDSEYPNLFLSSWGCPMQPKNVSLMLKNTAKKAGIDNWESISNHWLRTAAATMQSEAGQPIEVIQEMLGHSSINTTRRYVKIADKRLQQAMSVQLF